MKFWEINYERLDLKKIKNELVSLEKQYKKAKSYEEAEEIRNRIEKFTAEELYTPISYANIRNSIDVSDKFFDEEVKFYNKNMFKFLSVSKKINKDLINSPFKAEYIENGYGLKLKIAEVSLRQQSFKTVLLDIKESMLMMDYSKVTAQAKTDFDGKQLNFYGLLKEMQDPDREHRKNALKAWSDLYESISGKLDDIYDKLVKIRCRQAKKLKYDNFVKMVYDRRSIFDYTPEDVKTFKELVAEHIVPVCAKLREEQAKRLGVDKLYYYDESLFYKEGALVPEGTAEELIEKANEMYNAMSKETGEFFTFMKENGYFDLETKPNKRGGGYCTELPKYKAPFIFSNFNGTSADADVLTHEAGHAFAGYTALHGEKDIYAQDDMTMDIAEIHSMSMEHFAYPYMEKFFGDKADKYRFAHLTEAFISIPYLCAVDEFQHRVFANPKCSAEERRKIWKDIEEKFLPWRDYGDLPFLENGGFWMQKQHVFLYPFYYIDYALSQICAFQFYKKETENHENAWKDYYKLCTIAGKQGYFDTLKAVNLESPFKEETVKTVVSFVTAQLDELRKKI